MTHEEMQVLPIMWNPINSYRLQTDGLHYAAHLKLGCTYLMQGFNPDDVCSLSIAWFRCGESIDAPHPRGIYVVCQTVLKGCPWA